MRSAPEVAYVTWIVVCTTGLLQALASYNGWLGLSFFRNDLRLGYLCAALLIPGSYFWFFSLANRNVPGLEGWQLFSRFGVGAAGGIVVVLILSSLLNRDMKQDAGSRSPVAADAGLDSLRQATFWQLMLNGVRSAALPRSTFKGERLGG